MKNGFYPSAGRAWRINSVGIAEGPNGPRWVVAILSDGWAGDEPGIEAVEFVASMVSHALIRSTSPGHPFVDISPGSHYEPYLVDLVDSGVVAGTSPAFFSPEAEVTRAQLAVMLWRLAGRPETESTPVVHRRRSRNGTRHRNALDR